MLRSYQVTWQIDVTAGSPYEAAKIAREIQLDKDSVATIFEVSSDIHSIDTEEEE